MTVWMESIKAGLSIYAMLVLPMITVHILVSSFVYGRIQLSKILFTQAFIAYMSCLFALVFLPFPDPDKMMVLTYKAQMIPFYFVADIIENPVPAAVLVVVFNILLTIPFGVFLRYYTHCSVKKVLLYGFLLSLFIESIQFTGIFFLLPGSFRLFDVDDLICNTLGTGLGYLLEKQFTTILLKFSTKKYIIPIASRKRAFT